MLRVRVTAAKSTNKEKTADEKCGKDSKTDIRNRSSETERRSEKKTSGAKRSKQKKKQRSTEVDNQDGLATKAPGSDSDLQMDF